MPIPVLERRPPRAVCRNRRRTYRWARCQSRKLGNAKGAAFRTPRKSAWSTRSRPCSSGSAIDTPGRGFGSVGAHFNKVLELRTFGSSNWNFLIRSQKQFRPWRAPLFVSDVLPSCIAGPFGVNTCDHVWGKSLNVGKLERGSAETIKNCLEMGSRYRVEGEIEVRAKIFGSISWCTVGYELAARSTASRLPNGEDVAAT